MKKIHLPRLCFTLVFAAGILTGTLPPVLAQPNAADPATEQWRKIHLQYIRPDMLAYWLDSAHQPAPPEYQETAEASLYPEFQKMVGGSRLREPIITKPGQYVVATDPTTANPKLSIPSDEAFAGLLTADDSNDDLWVLSTQDIFDRTQKFAGQLDHPLLHIDLKVQIVTGDRETMKAFVNMETPEMKPAEIQPLLDKLKAQGKVTVFSLPLTAVDGFTGSAGSSTTTPAVLSGETSGIGSVLGHAPDLFYFTRYYDVVANPTLNKDGTVTASLAVGTINIFTQQKPPGQITAAWINNIEKHTTKLARQYLSTVCTLANNQTMVLGGLRNFIKDQETVWFITAHYGKE